VLAAGTSAVTTTVSTATTIAAETAATKFASRWHLDLDRPWLGADYWAAPLQDWRVHDGAAECINAAPNRVAHLLSCDLSERREPFSLSVTISRAGGELLSHGKGSAGFRVGIRGPLGDYRNALLYGKGLDVGMTSDGRPFIGKPASETQVDKSFANEKSVQLHLQAEPADQGFTLTLTVRRADGKTVLASVTKSQVAFEQMVGNLALVANFGGPESAPGKKNAKAKQSSDSSLNLGVGQFRFEQWSVAGAKVDTHADRAFGPILFSQYTLSGGTLKLTAQMPPLGDQDSPHVKLVAGERTATTTIHAEARTATFRFDQWTATNDVPYRLEYEFKSRDQSTTHTWTGTIRREPLDKPAFSVADISCNIHSAFPNTRYVEHVRHVDPDFLAFVGDQFYESTAGYGVTVKPLNAAILDYLRKWYIHGWTWRELLRDRPSISLPDDHDVYQGNIWGENGAPQGATQESGGYRMPAEWVNVVHRTQTSHHPDAHDPTPVEQGITQYYGRLIYGGLDFVLLADRMYKTGPEGAVPPTGGRADHVTDPKFDPRTADLPGLQLLGAKQEKFLADWAEDWSAGKLKVVVSQTIFTAMATTHGGPNGRLVADYDTNGWPQTARTRAVRSIRKACAFHLAGDQHLPAVVQYGIDAHRDGPFAFAGPAVNVGYPRWWEPLKPGENRAPGQSEIMGDFFDSFGNHLTVVAVANGEKEPRLPVLEAMTDKASGLGIVRFDKATRRVTIECWPFDVDPTAAGAKQFAGWPVTVELPQPSVS
jgi:phosphodiesterase/alkaline phosphatase D-like protein